MKNLLEDIFLYQNSVFKKCIEASIEMHKKIPPIDKVAWDWIPKKNEPTLLEGNSNFSLLIPQAFELLKNQE